MTVVLIRFKWMVILSLMLCYNSVFAQQKSLQLEDVLRQVNQFYPQIKIALLEINKAQGRYLSALGKFDLSVNADTASQPIGGYINNYGNTELNIPTFYNGLRFFAGYRNGQGNWPIYYQNYLTNSAGEYRAGLTLPLAKDRLIDRDRADVITQEESVRLKQQDAALTRIKIYQETIKAYWQWMEAGMQLKIFEHLLKLAQIRQKAIVKQANLGDLAQVAIAENMQQIVQRQQLLNQGEMVFRQASINLSLYYRDELGNPKIPTQNDLPADLSEEVIKNNRQLSELTHHPAVKRLENYSKIVSIKKRLAKNELLPQLNAIAYTFKQNGTDGYPLLIPQALMAGVTFQFPLQQRQAKGKLLSTESELQQVNAEKKFVYEQLRNELTNLLVAVNVYQKQVQLLKKELKLANQVQFAETKKFFEGDSTLFLVNQREQATTQVELNWVNAKIKLHELSDLTRFFSSANYV